MYCIYKNIPSLEEIYRAHEQGRVIISRSDDYLVAKYSQQTVISEDWDNLTMNARGTIYDERTGDVIFLPFKKFFNHAENALAASSLPSNGIVKAEILEKLDGSCGAVWIDRNGELRISTPGSLESDQAIWATNWLRNHKNYNKIRETFQSGHIHGLVAEILFPGSQVVVQYNYQEVEGIHLTAAQIKRESGKVQYASHDELKSLSKEFDLGLCNIYDFDSFDQLRSHLKEVDNFEGFILHWPDSGFRLKLKADEYIRLHRIISRIHPNRISEAIQSKEAQQSGDFDTILRIVWETSTAFPEEHRKPYQRAYEQMKKELKEIQSEVSSGVEELKKTHEMLTGPAFKKACAIDIKNGSAGFDKKYAPVAFSLLNGSVIPASKVAMNIWKRIRNEIDWQGGDSAESE